MNSGCLSFIIIELSCFMVLHPFPEDMELKERTGYDTAMNEDLPQAVSNLAIVLLQVGGDQSRKITPL